MTQTIHIDRFSISIYHGVAAVVFAHGSFTVACLGERNPKTLIEKIKQSAHDAHIAKHITRTEIKKIARALSNIDEGALQ